MQWWLPFKEVKRLAAAFPQSRVARDEFALILRIKALQGAAAMQESIAYMANMKAAGPPVHMQLHNLAMRNTSALLRHPLLLGVNVLSALGVGLLCGVFYYQLGDNLAGIINRAGLVFCKSTVANVWSMLLIQRPHPLCERKHTRCIAL